MRASPASTTPNVLTEVPVLSGISGFATVREEVIRVAALVVDRRVQGNSVERVTQTWEPTDMGVEVDASTSSQQIGEQPGCAAHFACSRTIWKGCGRTQCDQCDSALATPSDCLSSTSRVCPR